MKFSDRLAHAWNAFKNNDTTNPPKQVYSSYSSSIRPDRNIARASYDRSLITAILLRMAVDASSVNISHARTDENGNYLETIKSGLNNCLLLDANTDQTGAAFIKDVIMSMFDEGVVAIVPTDTDLNPNLTGGYDILKMRTGKIVNWYPDYVQVRVYNEKTGNKEDVILAKKYVAIIENPFYEVMNAPNSTLNRLIRILSKLDILNEQNASGKIDLIIQLPYSVNTERRKIQAENRRKDIENQLVGSKYGIAYTDGTERITQLNRAVENNMLAQVEYFMKLLYSQFGLSENIFNGTANEEELLNYYDRTINPILSAITDEMTRKFLTKTARTQHQIVWYFRDPFKLVPVSKLSEVADTFIRNTILTPNEVRGIIGFKPSSEPQADALQNPNMYPTGLPDQNGDEMTDTSDLQAQIDSLDDYDAQLDELEAQLQQDAFSEIEHLWVAHDDVRNALEENEPFTFIDAIAHYASPYYDPVYAHEYYEKHKKLKGRNKLSEKGQEVADYVKKKLYEERDAKISSSKNSTSNKLSSAQNTRASAIESSSNTKTRNVEAKKAATQKEIDNHKAQMDNQISQLQDELAAWGASGKKGKTKEIRNKIARLREENNEAKAKLQDELSSYSTSEREAHNTRATKAKNEYSENATKIKSAGSSEVSSIKEDYENRLATEMGKIMAQYPADGKSGSNSALAAKINKAHSEIQKSNAERKKKK